MWHNITSFSRYTIPCISNSQNLLGAVSLLLQPKATKMTDLKPPPNFDSVEFPKDRRKLKIIQHIPTHTASHKPPKHPRMIYLMRGPELIHNKLIHKQYGIRANQGGALKAGHFRAIRDTINRKLDDKRMFAVWRVDAPWQSVTKKGTGHRMGGGKGNIDHYKTPIKKGRIIIELGGKMEYGEIVHLLEIVANKLPFKAQPVCQEFLEEEVLREERLAAENLNPFTFEYCVENNMMGCRQWLSPYDFKWFNKVR